MASVLGVLERHGRVATTPFGSPRWYPDGDPERYADLISIDAFIPRLWNAKTSSTS